MNKQSDDQGRPIDIFLLAGGFLLLLLFGLRTITGADIWLHLAAGRHALEHGAASIDPFSFGLPPETAWHQTSWLYDIIVYKLWNWGGSALTILAHAGAVIASFLLLIPACRRFSRDIHQAVAVFVAAWLMAPLFTLRPELFCLLFAALQLYVLSNDRIGFTGGLILVVSQMAWANVHLSFVLGPVFCALRAWEVYSIRKSERMFIFPSSNPSSHYAVLAVVLLAVSCVNPAGIALFGDAARMLTRPEGGVMLEWISTFYRDYLPLPLASITTLALVMIASVFIFHRDRLPAMFTFSAIVSAFMMVRANKSLEFCAFLSFPFLALSASSITLLVGKIRSEAVRAWLSRSAYVVIALLFAGTAWLVMTNRYYIQSGSASAFGLQVGTDTYPAGAIAYVKSSHPFPKRMLNIAHDGGYLLWTNPGQKVFTDPRGDLYGASFYERLAKGLLGNPTHWRDLVTQYDPEGILLNATWSGAGTVAFQLVSRGQWVIAYFDGASMLLVRKTSGNQALMDDKEMQKRGLQLIDQSYDRYIRNMGNAFLRPPNPSRLIGASAVLQALGRYSESLKLLTALTEGTPRNVAAWVNRGIAEYNLSMNRQAIATLEHAMEMVPDNALTMLWLGAAYEVEGRKADASAVLDRARKINPEIVDRFKKDREALLFDAPAR